MTAWFDSFFDEMVKISTSLTDAERRKKALLLAGLGTTTIPAVTALGQKAMTGRWLPKGVSFSRWAPVAAGTGLFWGTALPAAQRYLERGVEEGAERRREAQQELKQLVQPVGGVKPALAAAPKIAPKVDPVIGATSA